MEAKAISPQQMRYIYGLARKADIDNDSLHALVARTAKGKDSIKLLTSYEGKLVIDALQRLTGEESTTPHGRATKEQIALIHALARKLGWDDPARLRAWLEKRYSASHPRFLGDQAATKCIEALKAMLKGGRGERKVRQNE